MRFRYAALMTMLLACRIAAQTTTADQATAAFRDDVHAGAGLMCIACHKGEGYVAPARTSIAPLCAGCHSDAAFMRRFDPQVRVDQFLQYQTSTHGKRMATGEVRVATCIDCHGAHGIRRVNDPRSPVAPLNVTQTCGRCHGDEQRMRAFKRQPSPPHDWSASVHAAALMKRGDTSAPTCIACHGSHGATPPGVTSVANVCSQCHVREAELFRKSPKKDLFDAIGQPECLACHSNHKIESPRDAWVGLDEGTVCAQCHDGAGESAATIRSIRGALDGLSHAVAEADDLLGRAEHAGMPVDDGRLALREAREQQVRSRVLVHAFAAEPFSATAAGGVVAADRARNAGAAAMRELGVRRRGLGIATLLLLAFLVTLGLKIRRLPSVPEPPE